MACISLRRLTRRLVAVVFLAGSVLTLGACGKECDTCSTDDDCASEGLVCVQFSNGSRRCGSGVGATTCRVP
jgi:hypothetical protein